MTTGRCAFLVLFCGLFLVACIERGTTEGEMKANATLDKTKTVAEVAIDAEAQAKQRQIAQASANLRPLAEAVSVKGQPALGAGIEAQRNQIDGALDLPASQRPGPTVTTEQLLADAQGALVTYRANAANMQSALDKAKIEADDARAKVAAAEAVAKAEKEKADAEATKAWWWQAGSATAGILLALAGVATRLGLPGGGLAQGVLSMVAPMIQQRASTAETAVAAADVGRSALDALDRHLQSDPELAARLSGVIGQVTQGRTASLNGLFKTAAKGYVVDHAGHAAEAVDSLLTQVRGKTLETVGGVPVALAHLAFERSRA